jgi:hypothetical protein
LVSISTSSRVAGRSPGAAAEETADTIARAQRPTGSNATSSSSGTPTCRRTRRAHPPQHRRRRRAAGGRRGPGGVRTMTSCSGTGSSAKTSRMSAMPVSTAPGCGSCSTAPTSAARCSATSVSSVTSATSRRQVLHACVFGVCGEPFLGDHGRQLAVVRDRQPQGSPTRLGGARRVGNWSGNIAVTT